MSFFNIVAATNEDTVVAAYEPSKVRSDSYQSEAELEKEFIRLLCEQGYTYLPLHTEDELIANLRSQLEELNHYQFSDTEWQQFFSDVIANPNEHIPEKTRKIQEDNVQVLHRDDGSSKNITLIDKKNIHNNRLQVINQYEVKQADGARHDNRYDVTILVNGFPLVHVELKRRGVAIREAFNQINRYQRDSFWAGCGLYEYVQIFVISNGTNTKYYSNSTRYNAIKDAKHGKTKKEKTSNSFEFTSYWADANNRVLTDLIDFTRTFFAKHTILSVLTRYCIFTSEKMLMVMRPYQITATERILNRIEIANNYKKYGSIEGGGYIWHTTGSGKTLTSFKTARLASQLPYIDKVLFVVDRKDLDYQTMKEYDRFEKGAANSNTSTTILKRQLENPEAHIIITTIQKLATFIKKNPGHEVYQKHVVIIFDECHRSQFGDMHGAIVHNFKKYYLFGFTGTPIYAANAGTSGKPGMRTTPQLFGGEPNEKGEKVLPLHTYTIVDAINDKNVLPFRVDYIKTMDAEPDMDDKQVWDIDREKAFMAPKRISLVTKYILDHFDQKTYRGDKSYEFNLLTNVAEVASAQRGAVEEIKQKQRVSGFNSIFCVASVPMAKLYYQEFKKQMAADPTKRLRIATIYSYGANEAETDGILDEENPEDTSNLDQSSRDFLDAAIQDYNEMFHTNYSTDGERFQNYYKDVSLRIVLFGALLRMRNLLSSFDDFKGNEMISERDLQDYLGRYQDLRDEWRNKKHDETKEDITDDVVFEVELIRQVEINIDYILMLVKKYHDTHCDDKEVLITIRKAIDASPELRSKKQLIETFIAGVNDVDDVMAEWNTFVSEQREKELAKIIQEEKLKEPETRKYLANAFRDGEIKTVGTDIDKLMPPVSRFGGGGRAQKKQGVIDKLKSFFDKFFGIGGSSFEEEKHD